MRYYPIFLDLQDKKILVIGGGVVAGQKIAGLLEAGACVTVLSPEIISAIDQKVEEKKLKWKKQSYAPGALSGFFMVFAATNEPSLNRLIHQEALEKKILCNAVDQPEECDFIVPARVNKGDLTLAISTGGKVPGLSKLLRQKFEQLLNTEYEDLLGELSKIRSTFLENNKGELLPQFFKQKGEELLQALGEKNRNKIGQLLKDLKLR